MSELAKTTLELVSIPSVTGNEQAMLDYLKRWAVPRFGEHRLRSWRCGLAIVPDNHAGPLIAVVGHTDTVAPAPGQTTEIKDDRVYGCGASDMKAGLAVMMALLENYPLLGLFYDREEGDQSDNGLVPLLEKVPRPDLAIVLEPTSNVVQVGCVGSVQATVTFKGRRAHAARPWQGENAVYKAAPFLERLSRQQPRDVTVHGHVFKEVITLTTASTLDNPRNAVPGEFVLNVNQRFAPGRTAEEAVQELRQLLNHEAELHVRDTAPAGDVCLDHPLLKAWLDKTSLTVEPKQAWTDVAQLTARGIPAVNFGPGDPAQAHQPGEWCPLPALDRCRQLLEELM